MKREQKCIPNPRLYQSRWLWRVCKKCKMEFKNEPGWRYWCWQKFRMSEAVYYYLCKECASTQAEATEFFEHNSD